MAISATAALCVGVVTGLGPAPSTASSHREAPLTAADPQVDATDLYAFRSPDRANSITLISNWIPFQEPAGGPNFFAWAPGVQYDIVISNDGGATPDIVYRWIFTNHYRNPNTFLYNTGQVTSLTDGDLNFYQTYDLWEIKGGTSTRLVHNGIAAPSDVGKGSMPDYADLSDDAIYKIGSGSTMVKTWVGQADDPFFLDLRVFDLLYGADLSETGSDTLHGFNVSSLAIQVPMSRIAKNGNATANPVIGVWTTAERQSTVVQNSNGTRSFSGSFIQVSRLGNPLVNEVVVPVGTKDYFNGSKPVNDAQFLGAVNDPELPHDIHAVYPGPFPHVPDCNTSMAGIQRDCDLIPVFLTGLTGLNKPAGVVASEMLRLNMMTPVCEEGSCGDYSRLGVIDGDNAGFPNGRRLKDDIVDIALRVVEGVLINNSTHDPAADTLGDGVNTNDVSFMSEFPYLALPWRGSDPMPHQVI